ncbi:proline-rich protein 2-like [Piliocolobus tephrosceles]|uniref:proline-rich protein 2-like n=1 Tax=Piliocolobus tephrosceles TaxID=591936 RepID=UPI000E6B1C4D|nr:proline-rich protein 2-like [Piliocolobus tephrosceles]
MTIMFYLCLRFESKAISAHAKHPGGERTRGGGGQPQLRTGPRRRRGEKTSIPSHKMVAPRRRPAHLGAPHALRDSRRPPPAGREPRVQAGRTGLRQAQPEGAIHSRWPASPLGVRGTDAGGDEGLARPPRPHPQSAPGIGSALTSDAPREPLEEPGKGGGAARMNGAGGCSLATSGRSRAAPLAAARAGAAASRSPQTPGSSSRVGRGPPCPPTT